jgi:hypothetical protein
MNSGRAVPDCELRPSCVCNRRGYPLNVVPNSGIAFPLMAGSNWFFGITFRMAKPVRQKCVRRTHRDISVSARKHRFGAQGSIGDFLRVCNEFRLLT